jgi:hypothetical protein
MTANVRIPDIPEPEPFSILVHARTRALEGDGEGAMAIAPEGDVLQDPQVLQDSNITGPTARMITALLSSLPEEAPDPRVNVRAGHSKIQASGEIAALQSPGFAFGGATQCVL